VLLVLFVGYEVRAEHPMLDPRLFRRVGAVPLLITTAVVAHQHPGDQHSGGQES
jgi:hypothetical protein